MNLPAQPNLRTSDISEMENGRAGTRDPNARPRIAMFMAAADLGTKPRAGSSYRVARRNAAKIRRHIVNRAP